MGKINRFVKDADAAILKTSSQRLDEAKVSQLETLLTRIARIKLTGLTELLTKRKRKTIRLEA